MKNEKQTKEESRKHFDEEAGNYDNSFDAKYVKCMYEEVVRRAIARNPDTILDLGCGNGNVLEKLAKRTKANLYGADLSTNMVVAAKEKLGIRANIAVGDAENLSYEEKSFDVIICNASFHHYPNPQKVLNEIKRILKPKGMLILGDPTAPGWYLKLLNWGLQWTKSGDYHIYSKQEIHNLLSEQGFKVSEWEKIGLKTFVINAEI